MDASVLSMGTLPEEKTLSPLPFSGSNTTLSNVIKVLEKVTHLYLCGIKTLITHTSCSLQHVFSDLVLLILKAIKVFNWLFLRVPDL